MEKWVRIASTVAGKAQSFAFDADLYTARVVDYLRIEGFWPRALVFAFFVKTFFTSRVKRYCSGFGLQVIVLGGRGCCVLRFTGRFGSVVVFCIVSGAAVFAFTRMAAFCVFLPASFLILFMVSLIGVPKDTCSATGSGAVIGTCRRLLGLVFSATFAEVKTGSFAGNINGVGANLTTSGLAGVAHWCVLLF